MRVEGINTDSVSSEQITVPSNASRQMLCSIFTAKTKHYLQKVVNKIMLFYWQKPSAQCTYKLNMLQLRALKSQGPPNIEKKNYWQNTILYFKTRKVKMVRLHLAWSKRWEKHTQLRQPETNWEAALNLSVQLCHCYQAMNLYSSTYMDIYLKLIFYIYIYIYGGIIFIIA
jgi:hypothetical protein